jgi:hypothetical protein
MGSRWRVKTTMEIWKSMEIEGPCLPCVLKKSSLY